MSYDSIIEVLALALLEQANEVGCLEVLDGFSQRPDTEIEVSAPISEEMLILPLDKQEWPEECAPILKESGATTLGELVEYLNHCAASGKKPNVSEDAAAAMFPDLLRSAITMRTRMGSVSFGSTFSKAIPWFLRASNDPAGAALRKNAAGAEQVL